MPGDQSARAFSFSSAGYADGLGHRAVRFDREAGAIVEVLHVRPELGVFDRLLREASVRVAGVGNDRLARCLGFERDPHGLIVLSELVPGQRLTDILESRPADDFTSGLDAAFGFLVQALTALSALHEAGLMHGALGPGRVMITPAGRIVLSDAIFGAALAHLRPAARMLAQSLGILPSPGHPPAASHDVTQAAFCALQIALGRSIPLTTAAPALSAELDEVTEIAQIRSDTRLADDVRTFLRTALRVDSSSVPLAGAAADDARRIARRMGSDAGVSALKDLLCSTPIADEPIMLPRKNKSAPQLVVAPRADSAPITVAPARSTSKAVEPLVHVPLASAPAALESSTVPPAPVIAPDSATVQPENETTARERFCDGGDGPEAAPDGNAVGSAPAFAPPSSPQAPTQTTAPSVPEPPAPGMTAPSIEAAATIVASPPVLPPLVPAPAVVLTPVAPLIEADTGGTTHPPAVTLPAAPLIAQPAQPLAPMPVHPAPPVFPTPAMPVFVPRPTAVQPPEPPAPASATLTTPMSQPVRIKTDKPSGFVPRRTFLDVPSEPETRALPFVDRAAAQETRPFPWKAAAAFVVLIGGLVAGKPYLSGTVEPPPDAEPAPTVVSEPVPPATTGSLTIESVPAGAIVTIDGAEVGKTPLKLDNVAAGRHLIAVTAGETTVKRTVKVEAGKEFTVELPVYSGWVAVFSPIPLQVAEAGRSLGTSDSTRIMLSPGRHSLVFSNREFGFSTREVVEIVPGEERVLNIEPKGPVNVNASPWAEVWVDGTRAGETPLANLPVLLGTREFLFKHPTYGERRVTATITAAGSAVSVDFTRPGTRP